MSPFTTPSRMPRLAAARWTTSTIGAGSCRVGSSPPSSITYGREALEVLVVAVGEPDGVRDAVDHQRLGRHLRAVEEALGHHAPGRRLGPRRLERPLRVHPRAQPDHAAGAAAVDRLDDQRPLERRELGGGADRA